MAIASALVVGGWPAASAATAAGARAKDPAPIAKKRALARERRALMQVLRRNPRAVATRSFMRRARAAALDLPLTARLNPAIDTDPGTPGVQEGVAPTDDMLEIDPGGGPSAPSPPFGQYSGPQDVSIDGKFRLEALFSKDTIGLGPSVLELGIGGLAIDAEPFDLLDFSPSCSPAADPLLQAGPTSIVEAAPVLPRDHRGGELHWFTGDISLKLYAQFHFNSLRRGTFDGGGVFANDCLGSQFWTRRIQALSNPVIPLQLDGRFEISPALTTDGRLRLFIVSFDDAAIPQAALATVLHSCTQATTSPGSGAAPAATCDGVSSDDTALGATVKVKKLTAEVLIGSL
ncbi:MAG TPA: hypothetical protein VF066_11490 [Thermoleophilaceae bacterium]